MPAAGAMAAKKVAASSTFQFAVRAVPGLRVEVLGAMIAAIAGV